MSTPDAQAIRDFLLLQINCWNDGDKEGMMEAYRAIAPKSLKIEYVGGPVLDGWQALEDMWSKYNGITTIDPAEMLINGSEAACYMRNQAKTAEGTVVSPSIETYHFGDGTLHARYFHNAH